MKKYIDIYIDGQKADVDVSIVNIGVQYSIEETELGKVRGAHSKRAIKLPATGVNKLIAEHINEPGSISSSAGSLQNARIDVNSIPVLTGKAQLQNSDLIRQGYGLKPSSFDYAFFGSNADWFQDLGDLRIRDLGWNDVTLNTSAVEFNYSPSAESCFTVIKWAEWFQSSAIRHVDHTPAIFVNSILEKSFNSIGYNFSSLYGSDPYNRLIVPVPLYLDGEYANTEVNIRVQSSASQSIPLTQTEAFTLISHGTETPAPNKDPGDRYNEVGHTYSQSFKCPQKAFYRIKTTVTITDLVEGQPGFVGLQQIDIVYYDNGVAFYTEKLFDNTFGTLYNRGNGVHEVSWVGSLDSQSEIQAYVRTQTAVNDNVNFNLSSILEVEFEKPEWFLGDLIPFQNIIPLDWSVRELIVDLTQIFNLKWETDVLARTINAYPADYYQLTFRADATGAATTSGYDGFFYKSSASEMSNLFDVSRGGSLDIITDQKRDFVLDWQTDDPTTESSELATGVSLYSGRWRHPARRFPEGEQRSTTNFFAKVTHIPAADVNSPSSTDFIPQIPLIYPEIYQTTSAADADYDTSPRLLYYAGRRAGDDGYINLYYTDTSATSAYDFPASFMVNFNALSGADVSLSFCDETTNNSDVITGMLTRFHAQSLKRIEVGREYQYHLFWDEIALTTLSFRNRIEINNDNYILQVIDSYNPLSNDSTKTKLLLDAVPLQSDIDNKVSGPVGPGESGVSGGSGGAGAFLGGAVIGGSLSGYYEEAFTFPVAQTIDISVNGGVLPSNNAQIWVYTQNGQMIASSEFTVVNNEGANDQILFNWVPVSVVDFIVRFRYP